MTEELIKDYNTKKVLGIIRTENNGDQAAIDYDTRKILGWYRKDRDITVDFFGRVLARGNSVVSLIYQNKNK